MNKNVVVLGASPKEDRYSNKALKLLSEKGYNAISVNPVYKEIEKKNVMQKSPIFPKKLIRLRFI
jgi:uncharacterized protein